MRDDYGFRQKPQDYERFNQNVFRITYGDSDKMKKGGRHRQDETPHRKTRCEDIGCEIVIISYYYIVRQ